MNHKILLSALLAVAAAALQGQAGAEIQASALNAPPPQVNVIPTPKQAAPVAGGLNLGGENPGVMIVLDDAPSAKEAAAAEYFNRRLRDLYRLPALPVTNARVLSAAAMADCDLIAIGRVDRHPLIVASHDRLAAELDFLRHQASGQAYVVRCLKNPVNNAKALIVLSGKGGQGMLYAAATLGQMIRKVPDGWELALADIRDYPDFEERLISPEAWRYFSNDDALNVKATIAPFVWMTADSVVATKSDDKYIADNRRGRELGVRPLVMPDLMHLGFQNRRAYPDGENYECIGTVDDADKTMGYCPSNLELRRLKARRLKDFVARTEPGVLYLHYEDYDSYVTAQAAWKNRCKICREKWPSDELESGEGQAGAFAEVVNSILEAVFAVTNAGGFAAERDCLVGVIVPPYTRWSESDESWDKAVAFYVELSRRLQFVENVQFILREQGPRRDGKSYRFAELSRRLREDAKGHGIWAYVHGGDRRTTWRNWPVRHRVQFRWICSPLFTCVNEGISTLMHSGHANTLMKAEYAWNMRPAGGYWLDPQSFNEYYEAISRYYGVACVPEIFDRGRFFDRVYKNLYGENAGQLAADGLRPVIIKGNIMFPVPGPAWLKLTDAVWAFSDSAALHASWRELFRQQAEANRRAVEGLQAALSADDLPPGRKSEIEKQVSEYARGQAWAEMAEQEAGYYIAALNGEADAAGAGLAALRTALANAPGDEKTYAETRLKRLADAAVNIQNVLSNTAAHNLRIEDLRRQAPAIQERIRQELRVRPGYNTLQSIAPLEYMRVGVLPGYSGMKRLFEDQRLGLCRRLPAIGPEIMDYDVVCYGGPAKLTDDQINLLRSFVQSGGGLFIIGATPQAMLGVPDLTPVADWLGAVKFVNASGKLTVPEASFISQDAAEWLSAFEAPRSAAAVAAPLTGVPLLAFADNPRAAFLLANKYGSGRVVFASTNNLPDVIIYKIILWLAHNKIDNMPDYMLEERRL